MASVTESGITIWAGERFFSRVNSQVSGQIWLDWESFAADWAAERFLSCVFLRGETFFYTPSSSTLFLLSGFSCDLLKISSGGIFFLPQSEQLKDFSPVWILLLVIQSGFKFLAGSDPPQSFPSSSGWLWWSCEDWCSSSSCSSSLFTVMLKTPASSWLVWASSCSSLMSGGSGGSSWSGPELQPCCSGGSSSLLTDSSWTSAENKETHKWSYENVLNEKTVVLLL